MFPPSLRILRAAWNKNENIRKWRQIGKVGSLSRAHPPIEKEFLHVRSVLDRLFGIGFSRGRLCLSTCGWAGGLLRGVAGIATRDRPASACDRYVSRGRSA